MLDIPASLALVRTCKKLPEEHMIALCARMRDLLLEEGTVQPIGSPVTVVGDLHGQFWDLLELLRRTDTEEGEWAGGRYVFMGDFVDRGYYSLETVTLLFLLKAR